MATSNMTIKDILSWVTGDEFYPVRYENKIYVISSYRLGDEEFDYGIYGEYPIRDFESGSKSVVNRVIDSIPEGFIDELIQDALEEESSFSEKLTPELKKKLYQEPISNWHTVLEASGFDTTNDVYMAELSKIFDGVLEVKPEPVNNVPDDTDIKYIKLYRELNK